MQEAVTAGRLSVGRTLNMKDLQDGGVVSDIKHGVKLLARVPSLPARPCCAGCDGAPMPTARTPPVGLRGV